MQNKYSAFPITTVKCLRVLLALNSVHGARSPDGGHASGWYLAAPAIPSAAAVAVANT